MAFIPEDGTGLADANSYSSVDELDAYWIERGIEMSQYPIGEKQSALVLSTDHIDLFFGPYLFGYKATSEQALEFPRMCIYDSLGVPYTGVPTKVKYAQFEYAFRILTTGKALVPDPIVDATGMQVQATFKKVGPLEKRITYTSGAVRVLPPYPKADAFLKEFTHGMQGGSHRA